MDIKDRIQSKAADLFQRYGIRSITMDEIAGQLSVSKKTIYQFFADKDELVDAVIGELIQYAQHCCTKDRLSAKDAIEEIFMAMEFVKELFATMNPVLLFDLERSHPKAFKKFQEHKSKNLLKLIKDNLERGIHEELYRPDLNIDIISKMRLEGMMLAFNQEIFPANKYSLAETQQHIIEHFVFGVASLKGYKLIVKYKEAQFQKSKKA